MAALRIFSVLPSLQHTSRITSLRASLPIRTSCAARALSTGPRGALERSPHTGSLQEIWRSSAGLLGKLEKRPKLEMVGHEKPELSRGMKVRSSVKKLCDGCTVGHVCLLEDLEKS